MTDRDLLNQTPLVVEGEVLSIAVTEEGPIRTLVTVRVTEVVKGEVTGATLVVSVPGGRRLDGAELRVPGGPRFEVGERVLLFLDRGAQVPERPDGPSVHSLQQFMLGAFRRVETSEAPLAMRDLSRSTEVSIPGRAVALPTGERDYDRFLSWLRNQARDPNRTGTTQPADYFVDLPPSTVIKIEQEYTFLGGPPVRWFEFDSGGSVAFYAHQGGQSGMATDEFAAVQAALAGWNNDPGSAISLVYGGTTTSTTGLTATDGLNVVLWNDPNNEASGAFTCTSGGVLGIGGGSFFGSFPFANGNAARFSEGDVVINDGAGCFLDIFAGKNGDEVLGHEIGHAIGFGHSDIDTGNSLMRAQAHGDGRGAQLGPDDRNGAAFLYGSGGGGGNPGAVQFQTSAYSSLEGATVLVQVTRTGGSDGAASVNYASSNGSAIAGSDYTTATGTINWLAGESTFKSFGVVLIDDAQVESTETLLVTLTGATGATLGTPSSATLSILDNDDAGQLSFTAASYSASESSSLTFSVTRASSTTGVVGVSYATGNGTALANSDYTPAAGTLSWADGEGGTKSITVSVIDDALDENNETLVVSLSNPTGGAVLGSPSTASGLIVDNDSTSPGTLQFTASSQAVAEDAGTATFSVSRSGGQDGAVSVGVQVVGGTATIGLDYSFSPTTLSWANGDSASKMFSVSIVHDSVTEATETVILALSAPIGGAFLGSPSQSVLQIQEVGQPGSVRLTSASHDVSENAGQVSIGVERFGGTQGAVSVELRTLSGSAVAGSDFGNFSTRIQWASGEGGAKTVAITILQESVVESAESFTVELRLPQGGALLSVPTSSSVQILDDDIQIDAQTTPASGAAEAPAIDYAPDRSYAVAYQSSDGDGFGVFARRFDSSDQPLDNASRLNQSAGGNQTHVQIELLHNGDAVAGWLEESGTSVTTGDGRYGVVASTGHRVVHVRVSSAGVPLGGEITVAEALSEPTKLSLASDLAGNAVFTWEDQGTIYLRQVSSEGVLSDLQTVGLGTEPAAASSQSGDVAVVWTTASGLALRVYNDARAAGDERQLVADPSAGNPSVASSSDQLGDHLVVAWDAEDQQRDVFLQRFEYNGTSGAAAQKANDATAGDQFGPTIDINASGEWVVLWQDAAPSSSLWIRLFDSGGEVVGGGFRLAVVDVDGAPSLPDVGIGDDDDVTVVYDRRDAAGNSVGVFSRTAHPELFSGTCQASDTHLCLSDGRFRVSALWEDADDKSGFGHASPLTDDTGYFWFFSADNVEIVLKTLDGCDFNTSFWVFASGLTNVEVQLLVEDTLSGESRHYVNAKGSAFLPIQDTSALATCDTASVSGPLTLGRQPSAPVQQQWQAFRSQVQHAEGSLRRATVGVHQSNGTCVPSGTTLCLNNDRFRVDVEWEKPDGEAGLGQKQVLTNDTGYFWFFSPDNVELVIKALDGCSFNANFWVFAGGLTNVEVRITVTDTLSGQVQTYLNSQGTAFQPIQDTSAFATCPE